MYILHSLQGHASRFLNLTNFLDLLKELMYLILFGQAPRFLAQNI